MKKLLCLAAASLVGFAAFAEGPLSLTVDTKAKWDSDKGFGIFAGDDDFYTEIKGSYEAENGGAMFRVRTGDVGSMWSEIAISKDDLDEQANNPDLDSISFGSFPAFGALILDRYEAWIKPNKYFKVSIGTNPLELYNEEIKWDVITGAGLFEGGKHLYAEVYPVDGLTVGFGIAESFIEGDAKKIQNGLAAWATYNIAATGNVTVEYESRGEDQKRIGAQFDYNGIDNMNLLFGYSTLLVKNAEDKTDLAQHVVDVDYRMSNDNFAFEAYNEAIIRNKDYGDLSDRFAFKFSYFLNDTVTPWLRTNLYYNYNDYFSPLWAGPQLNNADSWMDWSTGEFHKGEGKEWGLVVEPKVSIDLGKGVSTVLGAEIKYASFEFAGDDGDKKLNWAIPFEIIVAF